MFRVSRVCAVYNIVYITLLRSGYIVDTILKYIKNRQTAVLQEQEKKIGSHKTPKNI